MAPSRRPVLDAATTRRLAVEADVDPRTLLKLARGERVRGMAGYRARAALVAAGVLAGEPTPAPAAEQTIPGAQP